MYYVHIYYAGGLISYRSNVFFCSVQFSFWKNFKKETIHHTSYKHKAIAILTRKTISLGPLTGLVYIFIYEIPSKILWSQCHAEVPVVDEFAYFQEIYLLFAKTKKEFHQPKGLQQSFTPQLTWLSKFTCQR